MTTYLTPLENEQLVTVCMKIRDDYSKTNTTARKKLTKTIDDLSLEAYRAGFIDLGNTLSHLSIAETQAIIDSVSNSDTDLKKLIDERSELYRRAKKITKEIQKIKLHGIKQIIIK